MFLSHNNQPPNLRFTFYVLRFTLYALLAILPLSCKQEVPKERTHPSVILISIDTLRADYLKLYNPKGTSAPNMEQFAREGVTFRKVNSQVPYTLPSHCTILTGVYPAAHQVRDNVRDVLPANIPTLAEDFKQNGYQTAGFIGSMVLSEETHLSRGFDFYDDFFSRGDVHAEDLGGIERRAEDVFQSFQYWMEHRNSKSPFFAFLHFYDPHSPYAPPHGYAASEKQEDLYAGEIKYVDFVLGKLFTFLKDKGIWNDAIVMITSDHGEMLNEHGELGHGFFLYEPALKVPLLIRGPGLPTSKFVDELVELADIAPTLLSLSGLKVPSSIQGESLKPVLDGARKKNRAAFAESYFASLQFGISPIKMIQDGNLKYIEAPHPELYDLSSDPDESHNLLSERKSEAQKLKTQIGQFEKAYSRKQDKKEARNITAEEAEKFAAIGYLSGQIPESRWDLNKDPKDYIDDWTSSLEATYLVDHGEYQKALALLNKINASAVMPSASLLMLQSKCYLGLKDLNRAEQALKPISDTPEALTSLAHIYEATNRFSQAEELYVKALQKQFSYFTLFNYVLLLRETGQKQKALTLVQEREAKDNSKRSRPFLVEMYMALEQWPRAESMLLDLIQNRPWEAKWYTDLAAVYQSEGKLQNAFELMAANKERFANDSGFQLRMGILLNQSGRKQEEIALFQDFVRNWPDDARGYFYLAKALLDVNQDPAVVAQLAEKGLSLKPDPDMQVFGYFVLGNAYERLGKSREAREAFATAARLEKGGK